MNAMCGLGEKDRQPIDPPPIVQLVIWQESDRPGEGYTWVDLQSLQTPFFALHVALWSADGIEEPISFPIHLNVLVCLWVHLSAHQVF